MVYRITKRNEGKEESVSRDDINISDWNFGRENGDPRSKPENNNKMIPSRLLRATDGRLYYQMMILKICKIYFLDLSFSFDPGS